MSAGMRKRRSGFFVQIPRDTIRDQRLSFRARGVLGYLLDHPEGWSIRAANLAAGTKEGRDAVQAALRELRDHGYYRLERRLMLDRSIHMGTAISETPVESWVDDAAEFGVKPVVVVQQEDGSFMVRHDDGALTPDGFEDAPTDDISAQDNEENSQSPGNWESVTEDPGFPVTGNPVTGEPGTGKPFPLERTEKGEQRRNPPTPSPGDGGQDRSDDADASSENASLELVIQEQSTAKATFEDFWAVYPVKKDKGAARRAWKQAVRKEKPWVIVNAARAHADDPNRREGFTKYPATWLNSESWHNPPEAPRSGVGGGYREPDTDFFAPAEKQAL